MCLSCTSLCFFADREDLTNGINSVYATTTYTALLPAIPHAFNVSIREAILGYVNPFFGVFFAPILTPHLAEKHGRRPIYTASFSLFTLCVLVVGLAPNFSTILAFRFLAGFFGGPCLILIEGTFADLWTAERTLSYYAVLTLAPFLGAAVGPLAGNYILVNHDAGWISWVALLLATLALAFGSGMPETYSREILRARIHFTRMHTNMLCAPSGVSVDQMIHITILQPLRMLVTEPIVLMITLYLGLNLGLAFQWFVTVPTSLNQAYGISNPRIGLAFFSMMCGAVLAVVSCLSIDAFSKRSETSEHGSLTIFIERRLIPAIIGGIMAAAALFWFSYTVSPNFAPYISVIATGVYIWGNAMVLISLISYLFDAYPAAAVLSALTVAACFRILCAAVFPLIVLFMTPAMPKDSTFAVFGGFSILFLTFPIVLYTFGPAIRARSRYNQRGLRSTVQLEMLVTRREKILALEMQIARAALQRKMPMLSPTSGISNMAREFGGT